MPYRVIVFSDTDQPISDAQSDAIRELVPGLKVVPWPKSMGWGAEQIGNIWKAYAMAATEADDDDFIVRVDSDVFFFNQRIFDAVARSRADLVGDGHYVRFDYTQGGCYFFRASAVRKINRMLSETSVEILAKKHGFAVEDVAAHLFARILGLKVWLTWFMMFPDELRNARGLGKWSRFKFSCAHFVMKNKSAMLECYEKEVLKSSPSKKYLKALDID